MSKAAQGFSLRRTDRTPQTASSKAAGANPRRTPLIVKRAIFMDGNLLHTPWVKAPYCTDPPLPVISFIITAASSPVSR
jgi:hypothetical protein